VAKAVQLMKLRFAVITSVDRDDLKDGGSKAFAETILKVRELNPETKIEVLIPDFKGHSDQLQHIIDAEPDVLNHNTETVPSLYRRVRPQGRYHWTLKVLRESREAGLITKTGMMLGLGEKKDEVLQVMDDLVENGCQILTLGQYMQPTRLHFPIQRFITPEEFAEYKEEGLRRGFDAVESGPLVRSSYHADQTARAAHEAKNLKSKG
jgi:lipoic acid synthetase